MAGIIVGAVIIIAFGGYFIYKRGWRQQPHHEPSMASRLWIAGLLTVPAIMDPLIDPDGVLANTLIVAAAVWAWGDVVFAWYRTRHNGNPAQ